MPTLKITPKGGTPRTLTVTDSAAKSLKDAAKRNEAEVSEVSGAAKAKPADSDKAAPKADDKG